uniref:uncharacterized protein LOC105352625 n=1 Tax=Fragaria vesca subsp. vesca TaxID=101020 RepID=UPI0005C95CDF|nr:PREDICTED: uncharacterized protein LOC105352625 [Fragaria vesca subsp. vesca]
MATSNQICNAISVLLDDTNYPTWHFLMHRYLRGHGLLKFVDGSHACPSQVQMADHDSLSVNTGAYEKWTQQDSFVICIITTTLSADALTLVIGCQTSREVWLTLKQRYAFVSEFHIIQLKSTLRTIQKGSDSVKKYFLRFKSVSDRLATAEVTINDQDAKILILAGLPIEYSHTRQIIRAKIDIGMEEVRSLLLYAEFELELKHKSCSFSPMYIYHGTK